MRLRFPVFGSRNAKSTNVLSLGELRANDRLLVEREARRLSCPVYLGDNVALCRILGRYKFYIDTLDEGFGSHVVLDGFWEIWLTLFLGRTIKPGMRVVDVGANFGYYTVFMADLVGRSGKVVAIEPHPHTVKFLKRTVRLNGFSDRTLVVEGAVGDNPDGRALLFTPNSEPKNATIVATAEQVDQSLGVLDEVGTHSIDSLLPQIGRVDFMKIDAEGAELDIFHGMQKTIEDYDPDIVLEFNAARYARPGDFLDEIMSRWPKLRLIDFSGRCVSTNRNQILEEDVGQDRLLFLSSKTSVQ